MPKKSERYVGGKGMHLGRARSNRKYRRLKKRSGIDTTSRLNRKREIPLIVYYVIAVLIITCIHKCT